MTATQPSPFLDFRSFFGIWWLIQTKPQMERRLARELSAARVQHILPAEQIIRCEYTKEGRIHRHKEERLYFPGYVFLCSDDAGRYTAAKSFATVRTIAIADQSRFVRELDAMSIAIAANPSLRAMQGLARGRAVEVIAGPYQGLSGLVENVNASRMVVQVCLSIMQQTVCVEMPSEYVEVK